MHPILFQVGGLPLRSFGVMVAIGFIVGAWIFGRLVERRSDHPERDVPLYANLPVWGIVGVMVGARLMYVAVEVAKGSEVGQRFLSEPERVLFIWEGGLVMYGGLFGALLAGWWCTRKHGIDTLRAMDMGLPAGFFGLAIGRIGCLLVGDDYGRAVPEAQRGLPFPVTLRVPDPLPEHSLFDPEQAGQLLYATQVWMSVNALVLGLVGLALLRRTWRPGTVSLVLVLLYALTRGLIEAFRGDDVRGLWFGGSLSTSQLISIGLGLAALALLVRNARRPAPADGPAPGTR